jgi:hypothetical protein
MRRATPISWYCVAVIAAAIAVLVLVTLSGCGPSRPTDVNPGGPRRSTVPTAPPAATGQAPATSSAPATFPPGYNPGGPRRHK